MNDVQKKELIQVIKNIETNKKIKDIHINYLLQKIYDLGVQEKLIRSIK